MIKKFRTSILINDDAPPHDDWLYIKKRHLKPTNLLRSKIKELRAQDEGAPDVEVLLNNIKNLQGKIQDLFSYLEKKGMLKDFLEIQHPTENI